MMRSTLLDMLSRMLLGATLTVCVIKPWASGEARGTHLSSLGQLPHHHSVHYVCPNGYVEHVTAQDCRTPVLPLEVGEWDLHILVDLCKPKRLETG